jgi:predicted DCC family thiol-disulfide oxidoreductase YuxK
MFHISRALYRELARDLPHGPDRVAVLRACEAVVHRLATDRFYFAHPERTLFAAVRWRFPLAAQMRVYAVIARHLSALRAELECSVEATYALTGSHLRCRATTRRGAPCGHEPDPRTGFCPWHRHLADPPQVAA